jgi:hypothetical protein
MRGHLRDRQSLSCGTNAAGTVGAKSRANLVSSASGEARPGAAPDGFTALTGVANAVPVQCSGNQ